jgi:hypothetical protein
MQCIPPNVYLKYFFVLQYPLKGTVSRDCGWDKAIDGVD